MSDNNQETIAALDPTLERGPDPIHATIVAVGMIQTDAYMTFGRLRPMFKDGQSTVMHGEWLTSVSLSPIVLKDLVARLSIAIGEYEKVNGVLPDLKLA